jgi:hypothetical protein
MELTVERVLLVRVRTVYPRDFRVSLRSREPRMPVRREILTHTDRKLLKSLKRQEKQRGLKLTICF